jgi:hypothetical protein
MISKFFRKSPETEDSWAQIFASTPIKNCMWTKWWGEGEVKMYLDGDLDWPTLAGTGAEDYAGTGWGIQNQYANLYQGSYFVDADKMQSCFYRYHIPDPVYFKRDIRVTVQQIGLPATAPPPIPCTTRARRSITQALDL